jgi:hypothetical protein
MAKGTRQAEADIIYRLYYKSIDLPVFYLVSDKVMHISGNHGVYKVTEYCVVHHLAEIVSKQRVRSRTGIHIVPYKKLDNNREDRKQDSQSTTPPQAVGVCCSLMVVALGV